MEARRTLALGGQDAKEDVFRRQACSRVCSCLDEAGAHCSSSMYKSAVSTAGLGCVRVIVNMR